MNSPKISIRLLQAEIDEMDLLIRAGTFKDRSDFCRSAIEQLLNDCLPGRKRK